MNLSIKYFSISVGFVFLTILCCGDAITAHGPTGDKKQLRYRTSFGSCPSRAAGSLAMKIIKKFEENGSLRSIKRTIVTEKLDEKHFLSDYKISYNPLKKFLNLEFDCPAPLMKVQIYKENGLDSYEAILVENGELFDPTYEVLLRSEHRLAGHLPYLAIPVGDMDAAAQKRITNIIKQMDIRFRKKISEVIINESGELTIILSIKGNPSSVFLGSATWSEKVEKLERIISYMESKKKIPAIINLTNAQKVVVKFNDKF